MDSASGEPAIEEPAAQERVTRSAHSGLRLLYLQQELILPEVAGNNRCWQFARVWADAGHHVTFITGDHAIPPEMLARARFTKGGYPRHIRRDGIDVHMVKSDYRQDMGFARRLVSFLRFFWSARKLGLRLTDFDAVLAYSAPLSVGELGRQLAKKRNLPFFFELADVWPDVPIGMGYIRSAWLQRWLHRRTRKMYEAARCVFTFSEGMRQQVLSHGVLATKVMTVPNGVNIPPIDQEYGDNGVNDGERHGIDEERHGIDEVERTEPSGSSEAADGGRMRVFYTGTLGTVNNVGQLVRAMRWLEDQGRDDIECVIVGRGNESESVERLARSLDVRNITFVPRVVRTELPALLRGADVGISTIASFPVLEANAATKFYDYLSSGIAVVINHQGWQADYLRANECGLSSPLGDVEAFAKNLAYLADHPEQRQAMGARAKRAAARDFDRTIWAGKMMEEILTRLDGNPPDAGNPTGSEVAR